MQVFARLLTTILLFPLLLLVGRGALRKTQGRHKQRSRQTDECEAELYKPVLFSTESVSRHNTLICRCFRLMYNNRLTVKTAGVLQLATFTPEYVRKWVAMVQYFNYVTQHTNLFE